MLLWLNHLSFENISACYVALWPSLSQQSSSEIMIMIMADMSSELSLIMKMMIDKRYPQPGRQGQGFLCAPPTHVAPRLSRGYKTNDDNDDLR